jgi:hypothetical protein
MRSCKRGAVDAAATAGAAASPILLFAIAPGAVAGDRGSRCSSPSELTTRPVTARTRQRISKKKLADPAAAAGRLGLGARPAASPTDK